LGIIGIISYLTCGEEYVIRAIVFIWSSKGIDYKLILKIMLYVTLISSIFIISMSLFGGYGQIVDVRDYGRGVVEARYMMGFSHANNVHDVLWMMVLVFVLLHEENIPVCCFFIITALNFSLVYFTHSRTGFIVVEFIAIGVVLMKIMDIKFAAWLGLVGTILCLASCIYLTFLSAIYAAYLSKLEAFLDPYLNGRLEMVSERARLSEWRILPMGMNTTDVDNGFAVVGFSYGYLILTILVISILILACKLFVEKKIISQVLLISIIMVIFMESTFVFNVSLACNLLLIMWVVHGIKQGKLEGN